MDDGERWLAEFFPPPIIGDWADGAIRVASLSPGDGWVEWPRGIRPDQATTRQFGHRFHEAVANGLALEAASADVFVCPYLHPDRRRKGQATRRRHIHADVDGPLDLEQTRALGAFAVASGTKTAEGPHGHVYVRLDAEVDAHMHHALCVGLGRLVGGAAWDSSKASDEDVLRPVGTLNYKHDPPARVRWLIEPDEPSVYTWPVLDLMHRLGIRWDDVESDRERSQRARRSWGTEPFFDAHRRDVLLAQIANAPETTRNTTLYGLSKDTWRGWLRRAPGKREKAAEIVTRLVAAAGVAGLSPSEAETTVLSAQRAVIEEEELA